MTAVELHEKIARDDLDRGQAMQWITERADELDTMELPVVILRELRERLLSGGDAASIGREPA